MNRSGIGSAGSRHVALSAGSLVIYCRLLRRLFRWRSAILGRKRSGIGSTGSRHVPLNARSCRFLGWPLGRGNAIVGRTRSGIGSTVSRHVPWNARSLVIYCSLLSWLLGRGSAVVGRTRIRRTASTQVVFAILIILISFDRVGAADQTLITESERLLQEICGRRIRQSPSGNDFAEVEMLRGFDDFVGVEIDFVVPSQGVLQKV